MMDAQSSHARPFALALGGREAMPGSLGGRRGDRSRRSVASGLVIALVYSLLAGFVPQVSAAAAPLEVSAQEPLPGGVAPQVVSAQELPPGGVVPSETNIGWTQGEFSVSDDGAAQYTLPLWVPPGRGKVTPELALSYDSRGGNGRLGVGWSLGGLSSITPCRRTYAQDGYNDGRHYDGSSPFCLGGNRLMPVSAPQLPEREYVTEREIFARIVAYGMEDNVPDYFKVWAKSGRVLTFGQTTNARLQAYRLHVGAEGTLERESTSRVTTKWAVNRIADRNGNAATVEYERFEGTGANLWFVEMRPATIRYAPNRMVRFFYEDRPDPIDGFSGGVHIRLASRINRIVMSGGPQGGAAELLREYRLAYQSNSVTGRSLLNRITECDRDGACKLPLELDWSLGSFGFDAIDTNVTDAGTSTDSGNKLVVGDIDGDGRDDLLYPDALNNWRVRRSTGDGFAEARSAGIPKLGDREQAQVRPIDVDRDGRMDVMVEVPDSSPGGTGWQLYRSIGATFVPYTTLGHNASDDEPDPVYFADLDGNGMPDFITAAKEPGDVGTEPWSYRLNTGNDAGGRFGPKVQTSTMLPYVRSKIHILDSDGDGRSELMGMAYGPSGPHGPYAFGLHAGGGPEVTTLNGSGDNSNDGDFNGDGLSDRLRSYAGLMALVNSGNGFGSPTASPDGYVPPRRNCGPCPGPNHPGWDRGLRIVDFNNDGRDDVLIFHGLAPTGPNDTERGAQLYVWQDNGFARANLSQAAGDWNHNGFAPTQTLDIDGDGVLDIVHVQDDHLRILKRTGGVPDQLTRIGNFAHSPAVEIDYTHLGDRQVHTPAAGSCSYPQVCPAKGGNVVAQHRIAEFSGGVGWDRYDHHYRAARADLRGRGWLGFAEHTVNRVRTGAVAVTEFDNITRDADVTTVYPFASVPKKTVYTVKDSPQGREYRRTFTFGNHVRRTLGGGYTVEQRSVIDTEQERPVGAPSWQALRVRTLLREYDDFGNEKVVTAGGFVNRRTTTSTTYRNNIGNWLIGLPTRQLVEGCTTTPSVCKTRESTFDYDNKGNPTLTVVEPDKPALKLSTITAYAEFGNVASVTMTDNAGQVREDTFEYGNADKLHPTAIINALGHKTRALTHSGLGVPISTTDPNGVQTTMRYDRFGRLRETNRSDGSFEHVTHAHVQGRQLITTTDAGGGRSTVVLDQLGRELRRQVKTFDGRTATVHTRYDLLGRVWRVSRPTLEGAPVRYTTSIYDDRDRLVRQSAPDGAVVRHEYTGLQTHTYDARNIHSYVVESVDGDVESRYEDDPASTGWLRTRFEYGPFGESTKTVAPDGTTHTMVYDLRGRRLRLVNSTTGTTVSTYNAFGEVRTETDGSGKTSSYEYDALGRVTTVTSPDGVATNTWDTAPNGIGLLANALSADRVVIAYRYDEHAHPTATTWKYNGRQYEINLGYDSIGRVARITYPVIPGIAGRFKVAYGYNEHGYLTEAKDPVAGGTVYWTAEQRNGAGQLERERYGNGVVTTRTYKATNGLPDRILTTGPGTAGTLGDISYAYDLNHNVTQRHDFANKRRELYEYDELNRLDRWHTTVPGQGYVAINATYAYDKLGNLTRETFQTQGEPQQSTSYGYGENGAPRHAQTSRNNTNHADYDYDGAGRQIGGPQRTVQYNSSGLPNVLNWAVGQGPGQRTNFKYDPDGARFQKEDISQTIVTVPGLFEQRISHPGGDPPPDFVEVSNIYHIVVDGRTVAHVTRTQDTAGGPVTATKTTYLHTDQQGSTTHVTAADGRTIENLFYDPFGRRTDVAYKPLNDNRRGGTHLGYTSHEHDDEYGLINMKGRIYDPDARRFLTPDPIISDPLSSQSHNRYAYVWNNPTTYTDPTGFWRNSSFWGGDGYIDSVAPLSYAPEGPTEEGLTQEDIAQLKALDAASDDYTYGDGEIIHVRGKEIPDTTGFDAIAQAIMRGWWSKPSPGITVGKTTVKLKMDLFSWGSDKKGMADKGGPGGIGVKIEIKTVEAEASAGMGDTSVSVKVSGPQGFVGASCQAGSCKGGAGIFAGKGEGCVKTCVPSGFVKVCVQPCVAVGIGAEASVEVKPGSVKPAVGISVVRVSVAFSVESNDGPFVVEPNLPAGSYEQWGY